MTHSTKGIVQGNSIQCERPIGLPDGQEVLVTIQTTGSKSYGRTVPGEGIKRAAGGWDDDPEGLDVFLDWNRQQRKHGRQPLAS